MRRIIALALALVPIAALAQNQITYVGADGTPTRVSPSNPLPVTSVGATTGGSTSDASAANQQQEITQATLLNTKIGDIGSPSAGSVNARLNDIKTALGSPFQTGASIGNTQFGASQVGSWDVRNITGSIPLPNGAATELTLAGLSNKIGAGQTIGNIGNTVFGATQSGAWNITNITGNVPLPPNAATATLQSQISGQLPSSLGPKAATGSLSTTQATGDVWNVNSTPTAWQATGTISAAGQQVILNAPGNSAAEFTINGTFVGTITAQGCYDSACTTPGGRLLFKSGVGSTGTTQVTSDGVTATAREYRLVGGSNYIRLVATSWTSGSALIVMTAHGTPTILFVNGPVHTSEEEAVRAGRAYIVSSGMQAVTTGQYLNATITNLSTSNVNVFVVARMFECNQATATTPAEWTTYANPTTVPTTSVTPSNRMLGGSAAQMQFKYQIATTPLAGGTTGDSGTVNTGGGPTMNTVMTTLVPGQTGGVSIGGGGGGFAAAQRCKVSYVTYEEARN